MKDECLERAVVFDQLRETVVVPAIQACQAKHWVALNIQGQLIEKAVKEELDKRGLISEENKAEMIGQAQQLIDLAKKKDFTKAIELIHDINATWKGNMLETVCECECKGK